MKEWVKGKSSGTYKLELTSDLVCFVQWHCMKREVVPRDPPHKDKFGNKNSHQLLGPSINQEKYVGFIRGDEHNKKFFSNNLKLVQGLVLNYAKEIIKTRLKVYTETLKEF